MMDNNNLAELSRLLKCAVTGRLVLPAICLSTLLALCFVLFLIARPSEMTNAVQPSIEPKIAILEKQRNAVERKNGEVAARVWPRMRFTPPQPFFLPEACNGSDDEHSSRLANWLLIGAKQLTLRHVRIVFIDDKGIEIEWASDDPIMTSAFSKAIAATRIRRYGLSDFEEARRFYFDGPFAVIFLHTDKAGDVIIGATGSGFYFGGVNGSQLQLFESWMIAQLLDDIRKNQTGEGLTKAEFDIISGQNNIERQRRLYYKSFPETIAR